MKAVENGVNIEPLNCPEVSVVHITLEDVNDEKPVFDQTSYRTRVREDAPGGTFLISVTVSGRHAVFTYAETVSYTHLTLPTTILV